MDAWGGFTPALYKNTIVEVSASTTHKARQLDDLAETGQQTKGCNHTEEVELKKTQSRLQMKERLFRLNRRETITVCCLLSSMFKNATLQQN